MPPWKKGQLAVNPGGLTNREKAIRYRLQGLSLKAIDQLEKILEKGSNSEKLIAAKEVLDRSLGKAKIHANVDVSHSTTGHLDALVAIAANTAQRVGHVPAIVPQLEGQAIDITEHVTNLENKEHVDVRPLEDNEHTQDRKKD